MTADKYYREVLLIWGRLAGPMFPRLRKKIRETLADPSATEANYADLISEVNRAGGPQIGRMRDKRSNDPVDWEMFKEATKRAPKQYEITRVLIEAKDWIELSELADLVWEDPLKTTSAIAQLIKRTNETLKTIHVSVSIRRDGERAIADIVS